LFLGDFVVVVVVVIIVVVVVVVLVVIMGAFSSTYEIKITDISLVVLFFCQHYTTQVIFFCF
jgi:hypothetical protein